MTKLEDLHIVIYDIEVFAKNWIVVFKDITTGKLTSIHDSIYEIKQFIAGYDFLHLVLCGFNNKHYDDWILMDILNGCSHDDIKKHSNWIIQGNDPWVYPTVQYKKKPFKSFDLKDDIPNGLSLKQIEGYLGMNIKESDISFDVDYELTVLQVGEEENYCAQDVAATFKLYEERKDYIESKAIVGEMYGIPADEALGYTNAGLAAKVLGATATTRIDERDYTIPDQIDLLLIPQSILNFFMEIQNINIPDDVLFDTKLNIIYETNNGQCPTTYAWGGVHGAKPHFQYEVDDKHLLLDYDVSSLYPNSMINFGYCSRSMEDPDAYKALVEKRIEAKKAGDTAAAKALKLVVNSTYGAMLTDFNALSDKRNGRSVCITNQLAMTQLIVMLGQSCKSIDFVNINTDGLVFIISKLEEKKAAKTVDEWCSLTGFEMEREDFQRIVQKDVNNYIAITTDEDVKTKGSFVRQYEGGTFEKNSMTVVDRAIVDFLIKDVPVEYTINHEMDPLAFQNIVKAGSTYDGVTQIENGERVELPQKVNRVYAGLNKNKGIIEKYKWVTEKRHKDPETHKMVPEPVEPHGEWTKITDCPEHPFIDNEGKAEIKDIDKNYYIALAKRRIDQYIKPTKTTNNKNTEVIKLMANINKNCAQKLLQARTEFSAAPVKKSGKNAFAGFHYFELTDIVPVATAIFNKLGLLFQITFRKDGDGMIAVGILTDTDNTDDTIEFTCPVPSLTTGRGELPANMNTVQALGSTMTYMRRYMYLLVLDIVEADAFDATSGKPEPPKDRPVRKQDRPTSQQFQESVKPVKAEKAVEPVEPVKPAEPVKADEPAEPVEPVKADEPSDNSEYICESDTDEATEEFNNEYVGEEECGFLRDILRQLYITGGPSTEEYIQEMTVKVVGGVTRQELKEMETEANQTLQKVKNGEPIQF